MLDAKAGAEISIYGHSAKTKEEFNDKIDQEQWQELFIEEKVKVGDFFYIPAGTLHAIGEGILIYECNKTQIQHTEFMIMIELIKKGMRENFILKKQKM